jgi:hypothetical protein
MVLIILFYFTIDKKSKKHIDVTSRAHQRVHANNEGYKMHYILIIMHQLARLQTLGLLIYLSYRAS